MYVFLVRFHLFTHGLVAHVVFINFYVFPVGHLSTARVGVIVSFQSVFVFVSLCLSVSL